jgi:hypothetical protein
MEYIIVFVIGFALGWFLQSWISAKAFVEILKDLDVPEDKIIALAKRDGADVSEFEDSAKPVVELKVEQVGDRLMAYSAKDDFFVAQGVDAAALFKEIIAKHSIGTSVVIVEGSELVNDYVTSLKKIG